MSHVFGFVEFYLTPFLFAVGLLLFVYGIINYFIIGPGYEEERREIGRQSLLWATFLFALGLVLYGVASWLFDVTQTFDDRVDVEVREEQGVLPIPDVPRRNY